MREYGFLVSRRWVGLGLVALLVSAACVGLGVWQWNRHVGRVEANALVEDNYDVAPAPLEEVLDPRAPVPPERVWRQVELEGRYLGEDVLVRNRPVGSTPAMEVLTLFAAELDDGSEVVVVVDRGWLSQATDTAGPPPAPAGEVRLTGRLRTAEPPGDRSAPAGQVYRIEPGEVLPAAGVAEEIAASGTPVLQGYVLAGEHDPPAAEELPALARPVTDLGPHLSYAFQWWVFALAAPVGLAVLARREAAERAGEVPGSRRPRSDDEEDALIDAQLSSARPPS
ncbi:SURF1 family cytochrome oxidase biogenesis protein [Georgenia wangjunii]|uniref:SURF1 family cytochrome oxidase biogenesis protein n=1 Tax=Georgenia wangjunii TaxID=3117730 RepID=UPI002F263E89